MLALILSLLGVGGIGAAAFLIPGVGGFLGGALKGVWNFVRSIPWQVWLGLALAGVIGFLIISRGHWIERAHRDEAQLASLCAAAREASSNPKLDCRKAEAQIRELGKSLKLTTAALDHQNAAVDAWKAEATRQQAAAAEARKLAEKRAGHAESVAERAKASAAKAPPAGAPCEPSEILQESWK